LGFDRRVSVSLSSEGGLSYAVPLFLVGVLTESVVARDVYAWADAVRPCAPFAGR